MGRGSLRIGRFLRMGRLQMGVPVDMSASPENTNAHPCDGTAAGPCPGFAFCRPSSRRHVYLFSSCERRRIPADRGGTGASDDPGRVVWLRPLVLSDPHGGHDLYPLSGAGGGDLGHGLCGKRPPAGGPAERSDGSHCRCQCCCDLHHRRRGRPNSHCSRRPFRE